MDKLLRDVGVEHRSIQIPPTGQAVHTAPLLEVLWRRRWILLATVAGCVLCAATYLYFATPVYSATSRVAVAQNAPRVFSESQGYVSQSENFLQTQADIFLSTSVLTKALEKANYRSMKTFAGFPEDPVAALRNFKAFKVEAGKKSDVLMVTLESPYPREAATFVNCAVNAFIEQQSAEKRSQGNEMVKILQQQREDLAKKRDECLARMADAKRQSGVISFKDDKGNVISERVEAMNTSLTTARLETINLRAQKESIQAALLTQDTIASFVEAQQAKGRETGDQEYQEFRSQLSQLLLTQSTTSTLQGPNHPRAQVMQGTIDSLRARIASKQRTMVEAQLAAVTAQVAAAESRERQIVSAVESQQSRVTAMIPQALDYARLEDEAAKYPKQIDVLDARMAEILANTSDVAPLNINVLDRARVEEKPIKPNKPMVLAAAMMIGWMMGMGLAVMREWQDARLRSPEEIFAVLGTPVLATVPRISPRLSSVNRGQMVRLDPRSIAAEAYRSVRTSLYLGVAGKTKSIVVASPMPGDGKSTTASNLAIALAQAGDRTLLIDCDLREPVQHLIFEADGTTGLSSVMNGEVKLRDAVRPTRTAGLYILPCGPVPANPSEMLTSKRFTRMIQALSKSFDRIVMDSSPLLRFADGRILAASADATVLVLRMNQSMRTLGVVAVNGLAKVGANVVGAVANEVPGGQAYPYYGGSSQYVPMSARMAITEPESPETNVGVTVSVRPIERRAAEALLISEPDWSGDTV
jgi:succinoglycan biosynthesis transport protein ExoP